MYGNSLLVIFGGLPGSGKSTLARELANKLKAVYVRIDTIEQAIIFSGFSSGEIGPAGYLVAYNLASDNLRLGRTVVADSVNPIELTRSAWRTVAAQLSIAFVEIEVVCSDITEHRKRVESRKADITGHVLPTWDEVVNREYEPWKTTLVVDTAGKSIDECLAEITNVLSVQICQSA